MNVQAILSEIAIAYAVNRSALSANAKAIRQLSHEAEFYVDLKPYRDRYLAGDVTDDPECCIVWRGWLHAVDECHAWDDKDFDDDCAFRAMATLLDERKRLNGEGSKVKNRLRIAGQKLLKVTL